MPLSNKKNLILFLITCLFIVSCGASSDSTETKGPNVPNSKIMLGAYLKNDGWSVDILEKFKADTHKETSIITLYTNFEMDWSFLTTQTSNIVASGSMPLITLMPFNSGHEDLLSMIATGEKDSYINRWITDFKAWRDSYPEDSRPTILLRFGHEFNGNWYAWGNQPEAYKAAWRHIHGLFETAGVNNSVEWIWSASATDTDDYNDITVYYPGDDVVDWTSLDGYNWGSNYTWSSWRTFDEVFSAAYVTLVNNYPHKPILIAEVATAEPSDLPDAAWGQYGDDSDAVESKEIWISNMLTRIKESYPAIRAVSWFNVNKELSWSLNETARNGLANTGLSAYNESILDANILSEFVPLNPPDPNMSAKISATSSLSSYNKYKEIALSNMPAVVGVESRQKQAEGMRNLPTDVLEKIRQQRLKSY